VESLKIPIFSRNFKNYLIQFILDYPEDAGDETATTSDSAEKNQEASDEVTSDNAEVCFLKVFT
jgi:hypothetical protein